MLIKSIAFNINVIKDLTLAFRQEKIDSIIEDKYAMTKNINKIYRINFFSNRSRSRSSGGGSPIAHIAAENINI